MTDIISDVVDQRNIIDQLYKRSSEGIKLDKVRFLTWSDEIRPIVDTERAIPSDGNITSWDSIADAISKNAGSAKRLSDKKKNPLGFFSVHSLSIKDGPACPTIKETSKRLADELLIPLVYNYQGYSFTSEFNMVYKGTFSHVTAYEDLIAVVRKALLSTDPAISNEVCEQYVTYIIALASWDTTSMIDIFRQYLSFRFSQIEKIQIKTNEVGMNTRVYIGKSYAGHIAFTVRCECSIECTDKTLKRNEEVIPMPLIFYHDHDIQSPEVIKDFLQRMQYLHTETDGFRANAAAIQFATYFEKTGLRFYLKTNAASTTSVTETGAPQPATTTATAEDVDSDLSDDEDGAHRKGEDKVKFDAIELDAVAPIPASCNSSFSSELYGWGYDSFYSLGVGNASRSQSEGNNAADKNKKDVTKLLDEVYEPRPVPISRNIALEQVKMIACSSRHSVLLTHYGCLYACGDNAEGALGLGDMFPRNVFTLVDWSTQQKISYVACGSGVIGAHTMAIDQQGLLYGWGFSKAIGRGTVQPTLTPQAIPVPAHADTDFEDELMDDIVIAQRAQDRYRRAPTEVERGRDEGLSADDKRRRRIVRTVACGAGFTICVMMSGEVYAFGQWAHGRLGLGEIPKISVRTRGLRSTPKLARYQLRPVRLLGIEDAVSVACGEAHTLCLLASGHILTWGQNALGQLGIGPMRTGVLQDQFSPVLLPPFGSSLRDTRYASYNQSLIRRFVLHGAGPRYQRRLQYLYQQPQSKHFHPIKGMQVVCGAYHSIVIDRDFHCWTWGARGSPCLGHADSKILGDWSGRISNVFSVATNDSDVMVPYELLPWCNLWSTPRRIRAFDTYYRPTTPASEKAASTSYYYDDYAMVDQQYQQYGSMTNARSATSNTNPDGTVAPEEEDHPESQLDDAVLLDDDMTIISQAAIADTTNKRASSASSSSSSSRLKIVQVVAGDLHTMFITNHGRLYLCGSGPAVPALFPSDLDFEEAKKDLSAADQASLNKERAIVVHSPRCPSAQWLSSVCMRAVRYVSGGGCRIFALFDEETVSLNLTSLLFQGLRTPSLTAHHHVDGGNNDDSEDDMSKSGVFSLLSSGTGLLSDYSQVLLTKGRADCMVIASGYTFLCHRALLAKRSTELRDMILMETPTVGTEPHEQVPDILTQILLPELTKDAARVLCYFLYKDSLPRYVIGNRVLLHAMSRCGQRLKLPRLHLLSERYLALLDIPHTMNEHHRFSGSGNSRRSGRNDGSATANDKDETGGGGQDDPDASSLDELPPPTLSRDLGNLLGDVDFADVRFIAEGRHVAAHRFILEARCAYFRAMFSSNFSEIASLGSASAKSSHNIVQQRMVDVVVPDSFVGLLRLLIFIYTDTLPDGSDGALLEDLMAADRYGLLEMKSLCENMLVPNRENWLDLLRAADLLHAHTLKRNVVSFLRDNFHALHLDTSYWADEEEITREKQLREDEIADDFDANGKPIYHHSKAIKKEPTSDKAHSTATASAAATSATTTTLSAAPVIQELQEEFPQLLESLLFSRSVTFPLPPNQMLINRSMTSKQAKIEAEKAPFPYWALLLGAVCMYFYSQVSAFVSLGPLIPSINIGITVIASLYGGYILYRELYRQKRI